MIDLDTSALIKPPQGVFSERLDVSAEHCREVARLPLPHRDPFDRMLVAPAILEDCRVLSIDPQLDDYPVKRIW